MKRFAFLLCLFLAACGGGGGGGDDDNGSANNESGGLSGRWIGIADIVQNSCNLAAEPSLAFSHDVEQDGIDVSVQMSTGPFLSGTTTSNGFEATSVPTTESGCTSHYSVSYIGVSGDRANTVLICAESDCSVVDCLTCWAGEGNRH